MSDSAQPLNGPHFTVTTDGEVFGEDSEESREVARRIHACVNACDGISTEELENGIILDMRRVISQVVPLLEQKVGVPQQQTDSVPETPAVKQQTAPNLAPMQKA